MVIEAGAECLLACMPELVISDCVDVNLERITSSNGRLTEWYVYYEHVGC